VDCCDSVEEQKEAACSDIAALRQAMSQETFEKDALQQSCSDLSSQVIRLDAERTELNSILHDSKHKLSGTQLLYIF